MSSGVGDDYVVWGHALWMIVGTGVADLICFAIGRYYVTKLHNAVILQDLLQEDSDDESESEECRPPVVTTYRQTTLKDRRDTMQSLNDSNHGHDVEIETEDLETNESLK
mmetsp:Transcript_2869/g.3921  ORF Transcript_2869/g.3921 Transcript_2869/m.3921 type:complete len:110 (+) Transcript_2869:112-441(+)